MQLPLCLILLVFLPQLLLGQQQFFGGFSFEHEVTERYGYVLEVEHRQLLGTGNENRFLFLGAVNFGLADRISLTTGLRATPAYGAGPTEYRLIADLNLARPIQGSSFTVEARLRGQFERPLTERSNSAGMVSEYALRPRLGVGWAIAKHTEVVAEYEARFRFDQRRGLVRHRYTLGVVQEISTRLAIEAFYRIERKLRGSDVEQLPTIGLFVEYILPDARNRDWRYRRPFGRSLLW